jgi:sigma-B regulation protein RsbU (phosphoserine phosphatase)
MQKVGLSLRYQITILMSSVTAGFLLLYMSVAMKIFREDKMAYIFDSTLSNSRTLAKQAKANVEGLYSILSLMAQDYSTSQNFSTVGISSFKNFQTFKWVAVFEQNLETGFFVERTFLERDTDGFRTEWNQYPKRNDFLITTIRENRALDIPNQGDRVVLGMRASLQLRMRREHANPISHHQARELVFVAAARVPELYETFRAPGQLESFLIGADYKILLKAANSGLNQIAQKFPSWAIGPADQKRGVEKHESQGDEFLIATTPLGVAGLSVVSLIPISAAMQAIRTLIGRSVLFFGVLLSITIIVSLLASARITKALRDLFRATEKVAAGDFNFAVRATSRDEVGALATSFNQMRDKIVSLLGVTAEKARMENELKTAQTVQETLFPVPYRETSKFVIQGFFEPASECGGDWWFFLERKDQLLILIGDATGHGAPAALITSAARASLSILESFEVSPKELTTLINRAIFDVGRGKIMMTFFLAAYSISSKKLTFVNASHEAPYLIKRKDGVLKKKDLIPLNEVNSPRLGQSRDSIFEEATVQLEAGDRIFAYTDGLFDIKNPSGEVFGEREFLKLFLNLNQDFPPVHLISKLLVDRLSAYRQGEPLIDDVTYWFFDVL